MSEHQSLYDRLGGEPAVDAAVDIFYKKVLADPDVNGFFDGVDMDRQAQKQKSFLTLALGGPSIYQGVGLRNAHKKLVEEQGLSDVHFDKIVQHLGATLAELNVPEDMIAEAAGIVETTRDDVLNR